jgi:hypothetical protein
MTTQLTVQFDLDAAAAGDLTQVIASLPVVLQQTQTGADLVGIAGGPSWPAAAEEAIEAGARGVLVINPVAADTSSLRARMKANAVPVVLDSTWAHNPAATASAGPFSDIDDENSLVEARVTVAVGADLDRVLLGQLALIRATVAPVTGLVFARRSRFGYDAMATLASGARASLTAIATDSTPSAATLRILRPETAVELNIPAPVTSIPGHVVVSNPAGATLLTTQWETAHRAAWRRLSELVTSGGTASDLADFEHDVNVVTLAG